MTKRLPSLLLAAVLVAGAALADDSMDRATPTKHQTFKECIAKQKTADVNMSKSQMTRLCKDEMKREKAGDTPPPPTDVPHNP
jgi:pentapeptide MXKDX repeat protein